MRRVHLSLKGISPDASLAVAGGAALLEVAGPAPESLVEFEEMELPWPALVDSGAGLSEARVSGDSFLPSRTLVGTPAGEPDRFTSSVSKKRHNRNISVLDSQCFFLDPNAISFSV